MRPILALLAVCALATPAHAGVHMHMPHKHRHGHGDGGKSTEGPGSDIPEPVWTQPRS